MTFFYDLNKKLDSIRATPSTTHGQLNERDMSRAAKGYEKYGKEGMEALAKAGRDGKALDPVRDKYNKYDESVEEGSTGDYSAKKARAGKDIGKPGKNFEKIAKGAAERYGSKERGEKVAGAVLNKLRHPKEGMEEGFGDMARKVGGAVKKVAGKALDTLGHGSDEDMIRDMQKKAGMPQTGKKPMAHPKESAASMSAKQKSFAALAEPKNKITFADKIAGAKKEVDEMLGDVAAEAMKSAVGTTRKIAGKRYGGAMQKDDEAQAKPDVLRGRGRPKKPTDTEQGADLKPDWSAFGVGKVKLPAHKGTVTKHKLSDKEPGEKVKEADDSQLQAAMKLLKKAGYTVEKAEELEEKAVSKKQQKFMGMVHAAQKGEKPASKEVAKVAKEMPKKAAKDFAATKHKGLPEKAKSDNAPKKKKEKTEEAGGASTPTASSGFSYGKGIYDSLNIDLENMIAESMSVNMSMSNDSTHGGASKTLTVTATDDDAETLSAFLQNAGLTGSGQGSSCGCGQPGCGCDQEAMDEAYGDTDATPNSPDYPTNTETLDSDPQLRAYSGGINGPKSTGQTTTPVIASQHERQESYAAEEEDAIKRMMEMAGQPASGMGAQVGDMIDYVSPRGEQPPEDLIMQNGVEYDPDTNVISVRNATSLANTHRAIQAAGWKKQTAGARPNPAAAGQAQAAGDTPYQLGEQDAIARMMEMAGVKKKEVDEEKTEEGNLFTGNLVKARAAGKKEADLDGDGDLEKVKESIFSLTNQWKAYRG